MDFTYFKSHLEGKTVNGAKGIYKIEKLIAAGTGGMVMQGMTDTKIRVAVKYQNFISEHETNVCLKFLDNKFSNIINILDIFKNQDHPGYFIIMDFADEPLTKYLQGKNELCDSKSVQFQTMINQICSGLNEIHSSKIIHRDLKPDNIVVKMENNGPKYMLCDLGLVRMDENDQKKTKFIGTPVFMAPELCTDEHYTFKVDIWALGCMLYSLLAKKYLFDGQSAEATINQVKAITQEQINQKINQIENLDIEFKQLLIKMIQKSQHDRFNIQEVITQLNFYYSKINHQNRFKTEPFPQQINPIPQQIIIQQKPKIQPNIQFQIDFDRIKRGNDIQCNQIKDNLQHKLNEQCQLLIQQYIKQGKSYNILEVQQIIQQTIQVVKQKSFDIIETMYLIKLESEKKQLQEQLGQKDLKQIGQQTELNQKQIEINKNLEQINNLKLEIQTYQQTIRDLQSQIHSYQQTIDDNNNKIIQLDEQILQNTIQKSQIIEQVEVKQKDIQELKIQLLSFQQQLQNSESNNQQAISRLQQTQQQLDNLQTIQRNQQQEIAQHLYTIQQQNDQINQYIKQLQFLEKELQKNEILRQNAEFEKNDEVQRLLEGNQQLQNKIDQQKQFIETKTPWYESQIKVLEDKLESAKNSLTIQQVNHKQPSEQNQIMLGYLEKLTEYIKQVEQPIKNETLNQIDQPQIQNENASQIKQVALQQYNQQSNICVQQNQQPIANNHYGIQQQNSQIPPFNSVIQNQLQFPLINQNPYQQYPWQGKFQQAQGANSLIKPIQGNLNTFQFPQSNFNPQTLNNNFQIQGGNIQSFQQQPMQNQQLQNQSTNLNSEPFQFKMGTPFDLQKNEKK